MKSRMVIVAAAVASAMQGQNYLQSPAFMSSAGHAPLEGQVGPVLGKPFSGTETRHTKQVLSDGTPTDKTTTSKIYRDAEGRMRSESGDRAMLFDAPKLTNYVIGTKRCSKNQVGAKENIIIAATETGTSISSFSGDGKGNPHVVAEDLGFQVVNGISAKGTRQTLTIPGSTLGSDHDLKVVNERWYSEGLGVLVKSSNVDPRFGTTTYELSNINQSTPNPALFAAPSGCTESQTPHVMPMHAPALHPEF